MSLLNVIILAAGKGTRMKSDLPKVVHKTINGPMIHLVISAAEFINPKKIVIVTGFKKEIVEESVNQFKTNCKIEFAHQSEQLGTGHAVKCALESCADLKISKNLTLILYGDTPLLSKKLISEFLEEHKISKADLSLISVETKLDSSYGRIIRDPNGSVSKIVEFKDCTPEQKKIREVNSGIYLADSEFLADCIKELTNNNAQKEYYLTDIVEVAVSLKKSVKAFFTSDESLVQGVNDLKDLDLVNKILVKNKIDELLLSGVTFLDSSSVYIEPSVRIGQNCIIGPNVQLFGETTIANKTTIEGTCYIKDSTIGENCSLKLGLRIESAIIKNNVSIGPFAHIRANTELNEDVKIGNFVETKNSILHKGVKANHLSYLGDAEIGEDSNIGAGTITCNYDGYKKSKTTLGKNVFIGSNTSLVAPLTINDNVVIGAGSVITKDIEAGSLALTRAPLVKKNGWVKIK